MRAIFNYDEFKRLRKALRNIFNILKIGNKIIIEGYQPDKDPLENKIPPPKSP